MWLINTRTYALRQVTNAEDGYPYAILSHTWDESEDNPFHAEVTFQDMSDLNYACQKTGWAKVEYTCQLAWNSGLKWAWIDTCCIDKSSSAELSEAINSMFQWYNQAQVCYAYLSDLIDMSDQTDESYMDDHLPNCRWFTRGWTLQELLASRTIIFYDRLWNERGTKSSLESSISTITGIKVAVLQDFRKMFTTPVAQRMCWASKRNTKRVEDKAYCLLGVFDINMPLIYGEGSKAFRRLQSAIAGQVIDFTLFAWYSHKDNVSDLERPQEYCGLLAESPQDFLRCQFIGPLEDPARNEELYFTNADREITFRTSTYFDSESGSHWMNLHCADLGGQDSIQSGNSIAIRLIKTPTGFVRCRGRRRLDFWADGLTAFNTGIPENVRILKHIGYKDLCDLETRKSDAFKFRLECPRGITFELDIQDQNGWPSIDQVPGSWDRAAMTFMTTSSMLFAGLLCLKISYDIDGHHTESMKLVFGFHNRASFMHPTWLRESQGEYQMIPWAYLFGGAGSSILYGTADFQSQALTKRLKQDINDGVCYKLAASSLAEEVHKVHDIIPDGLGGLREAEIWPRAHRYQTKRKDALKLSLHSQTQMEDGLPVHYVTIRLESVVPERWGRSFVHTVAP